MPITLGRGAIKLIHGAIDKLFDKITGRYLGPESAQRGDKRIKISYRPNMTLQAVYDGAAREEATRPSPDSVQSLVDVAKGYLDLNREQTKIKAVHAVQSFLRNAEAEGTATDVETVLGSQLADIWGKTTEGVTKILDTEATKARNLGTLEGISKVNASLNIEDPVVCFITVRDAERCKECTKIHLLDDGVTPRVWLLSEVENGYHVRGVDRPCWSGLHPYCRCLFDGLAPVVTERGIVPLKKIVIGDRVLTHTGKFKKVLGTFGSNGRSPDSTDDLYRIEFKTPQGRVHKLRTTADHLMMIGDGTWKRSDELIPGVDKLQYLFKACEFCKNPMAYDIKKPKARFCSNVCAGDFRIGKPNLATLGRIEPDEAKKQRIAAIAETSFQTVEITKIVRVPKSKVSYSAKLYDITVEDDASFVVMGVVSHNCTASTILPGYGFDAGGMITYIGRDHNEFKKQRG